MAKIKHPKLNVSREVGDASSWQAAGWLLDEPEPAAEPTPTPEPADDPEVAEDAPKPSRRRKAD